jgi:hypothetical protein
MVRSVRRSVRSPRTSRPRRNVPSRVALFIGIAAAAAHSFGQGLSIQPTTISGHEIGETYQKWLANNQEIERLESVCSSKAHGAQGKIQKADCERLRNIRDGKLDEITSSEGNRTFIWRFQNKRLAKVEVDLPGPTAQSSVQPDIQQEFSFLIQRYGPPKATRVVPHQNAYGVRLDCSEMNWVMPDKTKIIATESIENASMLGAASRRKLVVLFLSADAQSSGQSRSNPY